MFEKRAQKSRTPRSGFFRSAERSGYGVRGGVGEGGLAALHFGEGFLDHLLGDASALAALSPYFERITHFPVAAAPFIDGFANLTVSDTQAETDVHGDSGLERG